MKVLIACEESQRECIAFREQGHEAYSCDLKPCSGGHPEWHIQRDVLPLLKERWDLIIAHPPCTDLAVSGARHFAQKKADGRQQKSIEFFLEFTRIDCERVAIENPISIMSTIYRKPDQIIQPWQYGHTESKKTCLWLKGLPKLIPTKIVNPGRKDKYGFTDGSIIQMPRDENGKILTWTDPRVSELRSKTYPGIAKAMAEQWGR